MAWGRLHLHALMPTGGHNEMSVSSELMFVPESRAEPLGLKDAPLPIFIPWYPQQAQHIVGVQKNGHWIDEGTAVVVKADHPPIPTRKMHCVKASQINRILPVGDPRSVIL